jgi:methylenetetrahydrofolate dehydrogenase (NADP+)/methenyltetrahydrofolate cyclohydrolase
MTAKILDGKSIALQIREEITAKVASFAKQTGVVPKLNAILVGNDPASKVYVRNKELACQKAGIAGEVIRLPQDTTQDELLKQVETLNRDSSCHGILVQLPVPKHIDARKVLDAVSPDKDVDCFSPVNVGLLSQGRPRFLPCTPHGVQQLLGRCNLPVEGKHVVVVGRSDIVGKPLAMMLAASEGPFGRTNANGTVTVCHSRTLDLRSITMQADILIAAIGKPKFITADMVKANAIVIDVGINQTEDGLCGDVDYESLLPKVSAITPVPGGVGPLTIAMLLQNTLTAAEHATSRSA